MLIDGQARVCTGPSGDEIPLLDLPTFSNASARFLIDIIGDLIMIPINDLIIIYHP